MAALVDHGVLLESARGPVPNLAELVVGEPIRGSWWAHPASHEIFAAVNLLASSPDVERMRLVGGKVTLVHRRLWPALARLADRIGPARLAVLRQEHTAAGTHRVEEIPFPEWVPPDDMAAAADLSEEAALALLPACLRPARP